jgi:hypothetical protein
MQRPDQAKRLQPGELFRRACGEDFFEVRVTRFQLAVAGVSADRFFAREQLLEFRIAANRVPHRIHLEPVH